MVEKAAGQADLVVVQVHMGAEGSDKTHVKPGTELFFGENRGDPIKFSKTVIDAGADVVVGHGPHVLRGHGVLQGQADRVQPGQLRRRREDAVSSDGVLKYGGVLHVSLTTDGSFAGGKFLSTYMNAAGVPTRDERERARPEAGRRAVRRDDFGDTAARIGDDGSISPPA